MIQNKYKYKHGVHRSFHVCKSKVCIEDRFTGKIVLRYEPNSLTGQIFSCPKRLQADYNVYFTPWGDGWRNLGGVHQLFCIKDEVVVAWISPNGKAWNVNLYHERFTLRDKEGEE